MGRISILGDPCNCVPYRKTFAFRKKISGSVWIQLQSLPLQCWNSRAISRIASRLGKPICMDEITVNKRRISYARVLVEINTSKKPVEEFEVKLPSGLTYTQYVVYENLPKYCSHCYYFGHYFENCKYRDNSHKVNIEYVAKEMA